MLLIHRLLILFANLVLQVAILKSTDVLVDMLHGISKQEQKASVGQESGRQWPQSVAVLRLAMDLDAKFDHKKTKEDEDEPLYYWNDLCQLLDELESDLSEQNVRQFGANMLNKAQVAYIMYELVGEALKRAGQRLIAHAGLMRTLVEHAGVFILQYGPDR